MKALMLHTENSAVGKYRIWTPAKYLAKKKDWLIWRQEDEPKLRSVNEWENIAEGADLMVTARADNPDLIALALGIRDMTGCKLVYEIDDNLYDVSEHSAAYKYWYKGSPFFEVAEIFMQQVDAITVSTPALVDVYKPLNDNIYVLPNYQDPDDWHMVNSMMQFPGPITIGWAGGHTHYDDLFMIRGAIKKILNKYPNVVFKTFGMQPNFFKNTPRVEMPKTSVHVHQYPQALADMGFDIAIAPVVKRPFNLGKSNIKWQEYSMLEIPTIASKVGEYESAIRHGETGFLASNNESAWVYYLEQLINDELLRRTMGAQAKQQVLDEFNITSRIDLWDQAYKQILAQPPRSSVQ